MSAIPPAPAPRSRRTQIITILISVLVLGAVGLFIGQSFIPVPGASGCEVSDIVEENGARQSDPMRFVTSCGDYYSGLSGIEIGETYDFELRGLFKTQIVSATPAS